MGKVEIFEYIWIGAQLVVLRSSVECQPRRGRAQACFCESVVAQRSDTLASLLHKPRICSVVKTAADLFSCQRGAYCEDVIKRAAFVP